MKKLVRESLNEKNDKFNYNDINWTHTVYGQANPVFNEFDDLESVYGFNLYDEVLVPGINGAPDFPTTIVAFGYQYPNETFIMTPDNEWIQIEETIGADGEKIEKIKSEKYTPLRKTARVGNYKLDLNASESLKESINEYPGRFILSKLNRILYLNDPICILYNKVKQYMPNGVLGEDLYIYPNLNDIINKLIEAGKMAFEDESDPSGAIKFTDNNLDEGSEEITNDKFEELIDKYLDNPYGIGANAVDIWNKGRDRILIFRNESEYDRQRLIKKLKSMGIPSNKITTSFQPKAFKYRYETNLFECLNEAKKEKSGKCPSSGCVKKVGNKWRIISNKTGKLWPAKYDSKKDADDALQAYHVKK